MMDTFETAAACGLSLRPRRQDEPSLKIDARGDRSSAFEQMMK